ncbi:hypothetical protein TNCV_4715291 [Trichonephila clavipes]|nr:hypothetical protein TNCV_4715291 [Trichonephila clavipes]
MSELYMVISVTVILATHEIINMTALENLSTIILSSRSVNVLGRLLHVLKDHGSSILPSSNGSICSNSNVEQFCDLNRLISLPCPISNGDIS